MRIVMQSKLSKWSNWLVSLSHYPPLEILGWGWWAIVIGANVFHAMEALHAPFADAASEELIERLRALPNSAAETKMLGDIVRVVGQLAIACGRAYTDGMRKRPWRLLFAVVGVGKLLELAILAN